MKELTIISGKGGTGKTSITASFADLTPKRVVIDADVDAANLFLTIKHDLIEKEQFEGGYKAQIDPSQCVSCGECVKRCQFGAVIKANNTSLLIKNDSEIDDDSKKSTEKYIRQNNEEILGTGIREDNGKDTEKDNSKNGQYVIDQISCEGCGVCVHFCPSNAISFERQICGEKYLSSTANGPMIHARLGIAEENSGLLVSQLRQQARQMAKEQNIPLIITDGPPGIGCPVIASISNSDAILIVAEPTVSGLHDMQRVIKLGRQMNVAISLCINKADLNLEASEKIEEFCEKNNIKFVGNIPFDRAVVESMKMGQSLVSYSDGPAALAVKSVWQNLIKFIDGTKERLI